MSSVFSLVNGGRRGELLVYGCVERKLRFTYKTCLCFRLRQSTKVRMQKREVRQEDAEHVVVLLSDVCSFRVAENLHKPQRLWSELFLLIR